MKVAIVRCECANPKPHWRLKSTDKQSASFFSVEEGKAIFNEGLAGGHIVQTPEETAVTMQEIEALSAETAEYGKSAGLPEDAIRLATGMIQERSPYVRQMVINQAVRMGGLTAEDGQRILALAEAKEVIATAKARRPSEGWPESRLRIAAKTLVEVASGELHQQMVADTIRSGVLVPEEGEKILAFAAEIVAAEIKQ
ncbi:MAG: hypothetical protein UW46_C0003G0011 [Candidatus Yanofskybacteria bacterium GW2011_GWF1_44_227]|uniref:Uncharacterized protein n=1 Tax=Candidatus Yanofskybacteria bacterium GW2011_GWE2_40_11 TaxID=1619033 RepID=A0A0G0T284_9BACT|nr:MAG: hypothetical protein UT69_C0008G0046 [Candidatus Yanofskybacteria bacterium GW2011_GWE1_40_10]KKR41200.1 MAG: hypothetical protein UT75_C0001G0104 [Candidatus Yanofskybacteria bacterium GW2011_GWE2_40_11]KKT15722.1 MAG: hypothetical protein UV97_C0003G0054 [Candidatus Yanofskybacteria bacterium GW2011_GWF2_43_596]KKT53390.1 MAG: hypothetical protein UW46_C0003G0011 [Candidatus Yanofskybacteria bacterium GW2011_GWF1_44_227]